MSYVYTIHINSGEKRGESGGGEPGDRKRLCGKEFRQLRPGAGIRFDAMGDIRNTLAPAESTGLRGRHDA